MRVAFVDDADAFARRAWDLLIADEVNHTRLLGGLRSSSATAPDAGPWRSALVVDVQDRVAAAALCSDGIWQLSTGPGAALEALGTALRDAPDIAGCVGEAAAIAAFARGLGAPLQVRLELPLLRLEGAPIAPAAVAGELRRATEADLPQLLPLAEAFRVEARLPESAAQVARSMPRRVADGAQHLWIDGAGDVAGFAGGRRIAPSGARIGPVYTLPSRRRRGIGGAMVAKLAARLLDEGARTVCLFTDAANPTSNALYRRIGFVPAGRHLHLMLERDIAARD